MITRLSGMLCLCGIILAACSKKTETLIRQNTHPQVTTTTALYKRYNVNLIRNVVYGSNITWVDSTMVLTMDIYSPKNASLLIRYPLLVVAHGGAFNYGSKENISDLCGALAEKGMIVATINYRLGWSGNDARTCNGDTASLNEAAYRAMQDLNASLRFLTANANKYFIDTNWIFTGGVSAGAVAALNAAYLTDTSAKLRFAAAYNKLGSLFTAGNTLRNKYAIKGICSMWGGIFDINIINTSNVLPAICYHGNLDSVVPLKTGKYLQCSNYQTMSGSLMIYNSLRQLGAPAVVHIYRGEGHAPPQYANNPDFVAATTYCFFNGLRSKQTNSGIYYNMTSNCK